MSDWIKVHRRLLESDVFDNPVTLKIWIWLLLKAQYKDKVITLQIGKAYEDVFVKRGSALFGRIKSAKELKVTPSMAYRQLKKLESLGKISVKSSSHYSVVTICKYELYQLDKEKFEQHVNNTRTTDEQHVIQHVNTNKKDNKENNDKNGFPFPLPEHFNGLKEIQIGSVIQLIKITKQVDVSSKDVSGLWEVFKVQNLTGKKYYAHADEVYSHFTNWAKDKRFDVHKNLAKAERLPDANEVAKKYEK